MGIYWFYVKNDFRNCHQISAFWDRLGQKKQCLWKRLSVCPKIKDEFINQSFLINGSGFNHKKRFGKNQKLNLPAKI